MDVLQTLSGLKKRVGELNKRDVEKQAQLDTLWPQLALSRACVLDDWAQFESDVDVRKARNIGAHGGNFRADLQLIKSKGTPADESIKEKVSIRKKGFEAGYGKSYDECIASDIENEPALLKALELRAHLSTHRMWQKPGVQQKKHTYLAKCESVTEQMPNWKTIPEEQLKQMEKLVNGLNDQTLHEAHCG